MIKDQKYSCTSDLGAEIIMVITSILIVVTVLFLYYSKNSKTRIISDQVANLLLSAAYALFLPLMSYLFSQAKQYNPNGRAQVILIWMVLIEIIHIYGDPISVWSRRKSAEQLARLFWVVFLIYRNSALRGIRASLFVLCLYFAVYEVLKGITFKKPKNSFLIGKNQKLIHNWVKGIMLKVGLHNTPLTLLNSYLHDSCLSIALAKILSQRLAKVPVDEARRKEALDFVQEGLIDYMGHNQDTQTESSNFKKNPIDMDRVFNIIEDELKYVSEFLATDQYSKLNYHFDGMGMCIMLGNGVYLIYKISKWRSAWLAHVAHEEYNHCSVVMKIFTHLDLAITILLVVACIYIQHTIIIQRHTEFSFIFKLFRSGIYNEFPSLSKKEARVYSSVFDVSILARLPKWITRKFSRLSRTVVDSSDAKEVILRSLIDSGGRLTNGEISLKKNGMQHLNWACQPNGNTTEAILVWHIATTLFHHKKPSPDPDQEPAPQQNNDPYQEPIPQKNNDDQEPTSQQNNDPDQELAHQQNNNPFKEQEMALALSSYCHSLVNFLPELLPDEVEYTEDMYESVRKEILAIGRFSDKKLTKENRCNYALHAMWVESSVVGKGAMLAKDLMNCAEHGAQVWKMLADFWVEMMLFIAPSDNVKGHKKILHRGEFITQLWALLTHAGILTRPKPTEHQDDENATSAVTGDMIV